MVPKAIQTTAKTITSASNAMTTRKMITDMARKREAGTGHGAKGNPDHDHDHHEI
jgi:hypothetical protein